MKYVKFQNKDVEILISIIVVRYLMIIIIKCLIKKIINWDVAIFLECYGSEACKVLTHENLVRLDVNLKKVVTFLRLLVLM